MSPLIEEMVEAWVAQSDSSGSQPGPELVHSDEGESTGSSDGALVQSQEIGELLDRLRGIEGAVAPNDQTLSILVRRMPLAAALVDSEGRLVFANDAYWSLTGKKKSEVLRRTLENVWPAGVAEMAAKYDHVARERHVPVLALERIPVGKVSLDLLTIRFALSAPEEPEDYVAFLGLDLDSMHSATQVLVDALVRALPNAPKEILQFTPRRPGFLKKVTATDEDE